MKDNDEVNGGQTMEAFRYDDGKLMRFFCVNFVLLIKS